MKITRRQLRRIIKEAIDPNADQQEAACDDRHAEVEMQGGGRGQEAGGMT